MQWLLWIVAIAGVAVAILGIGLLTSFGAPLPILVISLILSLTFIFDLIRRNPFPALGNGAYFSVVMLLAAVTLVGWLPLPIVLVGLLSGWTEGLGNWPWPLPLSGFFVANILTLAALFIIVHSNWKRPREMQRSFIRGSFLAMLVLAICLTAEYAWVRYHEQRIATAQSPDVLESVQALASYPFGRARFAVSVCENLILRDVTDSHFMYNEDGSFRTDMGRPKVEHYLQTRFGGEAEEVVRRADALFSAGLSSASLIERCTRWKNPT